MRALVKLNVDKKNWTIHDRDTFLGTEDTRPDEDKLQKVLGHENT